MGRGGDGPPERKEERDLDGGGMLRNLVRDGLGVI